MRVFSERERKTLNKIKTDEDEILAMRREIHRYNLKQLIVLEKMK